MSYRIGSIPYLNVRPLTYGIEDRVSLCEPSQLADALYHGQYDVGIVPIAEVLLHDRYDVIDGIAIASRGPVRSVFLAHREPVEKLKRVAVDPASRTSAWLVRVILKYGYGVEPQFYPRPPGGKLSEHEAMMLIGDQAIWYATRNPDTCAGILDLGEAWAELTGLPFVFAVWAAQRGIDAKPLAKLLRDARAKGLAHIEEIVRDTNVATPEFRREYFARHVWYDLGDEEKKGIRRFQQYLKEMGLVSGGHDLRYVG
jgi:chorismate dehydratase